MVITVVLPLLLSIAATIGGSMMISSQESHRRAARISFFIAGISLWFFGVSVSLIVGEATMMTRVITAALIGGMAAGATVCLVSVTMAQTVGPAPNQSNVPATSTASNSGVTITGGDNVVSVGQIGGITAKIVNINPPNNPELRILSRTIIANLNGSKTTLIKTEVASPITPGLLLLSIRASEIEDVEIMPPAVDGVSSIQLRNVRRSPSLYSVEIPSPRGEYNISVTTAGNTDITLSASF